MPLFAGSKREITAYACGECGGLWLRNADMIRILSTRDPAAQELDEIAMERSVARPVGLDLFTCCECPEKLTRHVVARVTIAVCKAHGTWFDRGQLTLVMKRITAAEDDSFEAAAAEGDEMANAEIAARNTAVLIAIIGAPR